MPFLYPPNTSWPCDVRPYNIYKSESLRSAEYGRTSPDSTNRQTHNLTRLRGGTAPPPLTRLGSAAAIPAAPRLRLYLLPFHSSFVLSHPCIRLIYLWHPRNHLTAYLAIAFNLTPSVGRFYSRPYSTRSIRKYIATYNLFYELLSISQSPRSFVFSGQLW